MIAIGKLTGFYRQVRTAIRLLEPNYQRRAIYLLALMTLVALLQMVGISSVLPLITLILDAEQLKDSFFFQILSDFAGTQDSQKLIIILLAALFLFSLAGNLLATFTVYQQYNFATKLLVSLSHRMLTGYLRQDYLYFVSHNSAVLLKNVTVEVHNFVMGVVVYSLIFCSNALTIFFMGVLLIVINPIVNGILIVFIAIFSAGFYFIIGKHVAKWGVNREVYYALAIQVAHQALSGVKDIKALGAEQVYQEKFRAMMGHYRQFSVRYQTFNELPLYLIDLVVSLSLGVLPLYFVLSGDDLQSFFETIAPLAVLFVAVLYRVLPAFSRCLGSIVSVRFFGQNLNILQEVLGSLGEQAALQESSLPRLADRILFDRVGYRYPDRSEDALQDITFTIPRGSRVAFVGQSGAGKTTLVDLLLGLLSPNTGSIFIDDQRLERTNSRSWRTQIGYVSQHFFLADATLRENILLGDPSKPPDERLLEEAIRIAGLQPVLEQLPQGLDTPLGERGVRLSGGERQRVGIARALYRQPRVLILDEATSALDIAIERDILSDVLGLSSDITVIIITHRLNSVQGCERLFLLKNGSLIASGAFDELLQAQPEFARLTNERTTVPTT